MSLDTLLAFSYKDSRNAARSMNAQARKVASQADSAGSPPRLQAANAPIQTLQARQVPLGEVERHGALE